MDMLRPLNLFVLFQLEDDRLIPEYDHIMSGKPMLRQGKARYWEIASLRGAVKGLLGCGCGMAELDGFFYSYSIPQIGKEFDLLRVSEHRVVNIELKSEDVGQTEILEQLRRNQYYLRHLEREIRLFTYVSSTGIWFKLGENGILAHSSAAEAADALRERGKCFCGDLDTLFQASTFLVSPLNEPERFLKQQYFLTQHQETIEREVLPLFQRHSSGFISIAGAAGTGKTLLLYDLARKAAAIGRVCIIHCAQLQRGCDSLSRGIENLTMIQADALWDGFPYEQYDFLFLDETHRIPTLRFTQIVERVKQRKQICVISLDANQVLSGSERRAKIAERVQSLPGVQSFELTNRIRTNAELAGFITRMYDMSRPARMCTYQNVSLLYAKTEREAEQIIAYYREKGYIYISHAPEEPIQPDPAHVIGQEFNKVLVKLDERFYYDRAGHLTADPVSDDLYDQLLYQAVTRAREKLAVLVVNNLAVFRTIEGLF